MFKSLRAPERLFRLAGWLVSLVFAAFLIGFGGKLVGDLPGVSQDLALEQFVDPPALRATAATRDSLARTQREEEAARDRAALDSSAASNAYRTARDGFENWVATRTATVDPRQDPEVVRRTRELDALQGGVRAAQARLEQLDRAALGTAEAAEAADRREAALRRDAEGRYELARLRQELRVFGIRLLLTLPLLGIGGWLVARKRRDERWPLYRGFVLFALVAFFVELVPYLPSYGGYVRYGVGAVLSVVAGVWVIRAMRQYVARREAIERQTEPDRRRTVGVEEALRRMGAGVCPTCERQIAGGIADRPATSLAAKAGTPPGEANYCVFCATHLFDQCAACGTRKNAFYPHCPSCGTRADDVPPALATA